MKAPCVLAVDVGAGQINGAVLSFPAGELLERHVFPPDADVAKLLSQLEKAARFLGCRVREIRIELAS